MTTNSPRVDFYVLSGSEAAARFRFTCRLTEKAYVLKQRIYAHTGSAADARQLDELLWTFRAGSFLPHALLVGEKPNQDTEIPILIGHGEQTDFAGEVMINLTDEIPPFFDRFSRVAEILDATPECRRLGRERFSFYRDNGYKPVSHNID